MGWILNYSRIFFDFDGLLVNTEHLHFQAYKTLLTDRGYSFPWDFNSFAAVAHKSSEGLKNMISTHAPQLVQSTPWDMLYQEKKERYQQLLQQGGLELMPGAQSVLHMVHENQIPHAVVTNSTAEQIALVRSQLPELHTIPYWITREDYSHAKPAPDAYLRGIEVLGKSEKMLGFEDSIKGIRSLQGTPITPVLICSPSHPQLEGLTLDTIHYFHSLADIV